MSGLNELAVVSTDALAAFDAFVDDAGAANVQYLKFVKGEFVHGAEEMSIDPEEQFAVDVMSLRHGFICWGDGAVLGEEMKRVVDGRVDEDGLEDYTDQGGEWRDQTSIEFTSLDDGAVYQFKTSSFGGRKAVAQVVSAVSQRRKKGESAGVPVITMGGDSYRHQKYGKVFVPVFSVVDWLAPGQSDHSNDPVEGEIVDEDDIPFDRPAPRQRSRRPS